MEINKENFISHILQTFPEFKESEKYKVVEDELDQPHIFGSNFYSWVSGNKLVSLKGSDLFSFINDCHERGDEYVRNLIDLEFLDQMKTSTKINLLAGFLLSGSAKRSYNSFDRLS